MQNKIPLLLAGFAIYLLTSGQCLGQTFKQEIDKTYNFHPHKLSRAEQEKIFPSLDTFFFKVKSDTAKYLPLLRQELISNDHYPYFYYDGSHLLMMESKSNSDHKICADAFAKTNIKDLSPKEYVSLLSYLSSHDINVTKAAVKILEDSTFSFFIPQHVFNFMQGYCLTYCLLPLSPNLYMDTLISIFKQTKDIQVQKSIITTIWFSNSCAGDEFLRSRNANNSLSIEVSDYAKRLLGNTKTSGEEKKYYKARNQEDLVEIRKSGLSRFSDEAIDDLDFVTKTWREKYPCR
jgi:hypothetical protein